MRYAVLATDYDGTLATDGRVRKDTIAALERLRASGRKLVMVTGREMDELSETFPRLDLFDRIVAENGAVLFHPAEHRERRLAGPPSKTLIKALKKRGVTPLDVGESIIATRVPHDVDVLEAIRELGLEQQIIFNKGAVMVLPSGTNKETGLEAALDELGFSMHNVVGIGDAENDHAFLRAAECAVAVENALPSVKKYADLVTKGARGEGVQELANRLIENDLADLDPELKRYRIAFGRRLDRDRDKVQLKPYGTNLLVVGSSKSGKTSLTLGILERLSQAEYQYCLIDPEGDYEHLEGATNLGDAKRTPTTDEVMEVLQQPGQNVAVSVLALSAEERPAYFAELLHRLDALRHTTARPHWLILDEAHHLLPESLSPAQQAVARSFGGLVMITVQPRLVSRIALGEVNTVCAVGEDPTKAIAELCEINGEAAPAMPSGALPRGEGLFWRRGRPNAWHIEIEPSTWDRKRHRRKYAEGELPIDRSFYFRGPEQKLNLRAHNLTVFLELADGVDDETWLYHLRNDDYANWLRVECKDESLSKLAKKLAADTEMPPKESRAQMRAAVQERYAPPA